MNAPATETMKTDVVLIGAGIMSATLGTLLKEVAPETTIAVFEQLDTVAKESSHELNNAGTGHAALCELNYTAEQADGSINIQRAIDINEKFKLSVQFWSYLVSKGLIDKPEEFIQQLPHMSFVQGEKDVAFLKKRYEAMVQHPLFKNMTYSEDREVLKQWFPLMMENRDETTPIAATHVPTGTDVNFGALTRKLFAHLDNLGVKTHLNQTVKSFIRMTDGGWAITILDKNTGKTRTHHAKFVFIGAGGGSLHLLQKTGIPESHHVGGFPVSGIFLQCKNPEVAERHFAKVYGKAALGAPPMSVPHLDTRFVNGQRTLLFGPFAGFSPKFLKHGSVMDLPSSVRPHNLTTVLAAGAKNLDLTRYLIEQVKLSKEQRMNELRQFYPDAKSEDWELIEAGQRVQIIKDTPKERGVLQFGTEVISAADGSVAALLGASPGASTSVQAMLVVLQKCFGNKIPDLEARLQAMIPSLGKNLAEHLDLLDHIQTEVRETLGLKNMW
ncbi:malate dehydrogenase (quinone) [Alysiella filiformis]|uniref:Probable malate:quinone oxidoreductase n=1 Tax=Alysiella filiformis DSM 16848 TaxID=1120981 RepID=A0A286EK76_9NEIS|nr:malate dehydrogenase (quinone) [Alysiella filiformis]QMT30687.1 malate dehydrogenase (quinone) [Alysiella filiformis]UBQ56334.1 malate dehydrogenase (quinone) [Alysiella filiformis DSM 16848]SOD71298.1 malate dehydrogenase (quinone) [Alysiella filiformis DSM 16848]